MTTSTSLSGRSLAPRPPAKGSFPLDHLGECRPLAQLYTSCLRAHDGNAVVCRTLARRYLECRMEAGLMAEEDLAALGISESKDPPALASSSSGSSSEAGRDDDGDDNDPRRATERKGFVAGMRTARRRKRGVAEQVDE
jgi:cytochrome c oxidase assembly protein subunit 19